MRSWRLGQNSIRTVVIGFPTATTHACQGDPTHVHGGSEVSESNVSWIRECGLVSPLGTRSFERRWPWLALTATSNGGLRTDGTPIDCAKRAAGLLTSRARWELDRGRVLTYLSLEIEARKAIRLYKELTTPDLFRQTLGNPFGGPRKAWSDCECEANGPQLRTWAGGIACRSHEFPLLLYSRCGPGHSFWRWVGHYGGVAVRDALASVRTISHDFGASSWFDHSLGFDSSPSMLALVRISYPSHHAGRTTPFDS
ncbi:hypothetical protein R1flu_028284 [Riccia fluitans]|uniref:Uncharacterized protein n=1 Tax=Riccia fluitans TaxID=41844 RepID=A0ABD1XL93_9MARC